MPQVVRSCFSIPPDLLSCLRWSHTSQHLVNSFSPALFEQGKYSLPFAGRENGTWRHTRSSWQSKELNHPSPSSRSHKPPLNLKSKGSGFCVRYGQEKFFLFRSSSIFILFIYFFILQGQAAHSGQGSRTGGNISPAHYPVPSWWTAHGALWMSKGCKMDFAWGSEIAGANRVIWFHSHFPYPISILVFPLFFLSLLSWLHGQIPDTLLVFILMICSCKAQYFPSAVCATG